MLTKIKLTRLLKSKREIYPFLNLILQQNKMPIIQRIIYITALVPSRHKASGSST
jgi:hypothetical protein